MLPAVRKRRSDLVDQRPSRVNDVSFGQMMPVVPREPDDAWPVEVKRLYNAFSKSGQSVFMQQTDWEHAWLVCSELARYRELEARAIASERVFDEWVELASHLSPSEREEMGFSRSAPRVLKGGSAMKFEALMGELARLMVAESDRRKARIELERRPDGSAVDASVVQMSRYREGLAAAVR